MKVTVWLGRDKSKSAVAGPRTPAAEMSGVPVRVTTYQGATRTHSAEAVVVITAKSFRSVVASAGEMKVYLSPRAQFRLIEPGPLPATSPATQGTNFIPDIASIVPGNPATVPHEYRFNCDCCACQDARARSIQDGGR